MNANEVIATRANALALESLTDTDRVHPNDDVNLGQSSNDVIPSVLHISVALALHHRLLPARAQITKAIARVQRAIVLMEELAIGGTAVGTGLNTDPRFAPRVCALISQHTGLTFREATNHFEAQGARDDSVEVAGILCTVAASLARVANDIRDRQALLDVPIATQPRYV